MSIPYAASLSGMNGNAGVERKRKDMKGVKRRRKRTPPLSQEAKEKEKKKETSQGKR